MLIHSIIVIPVEVKANCETCLSMTGGPFGDDIYNFNQLHFHWGSDNEQGSEHYINGHQ